MAARVGAVAIAVVVVLAAPAVAEACSCGGPGGGEFLLGAGGWLPADARGIPWRGEKLARGSATWLMRREAGGPVRVPFTLVEERGLQWFVPDGGLRPGDSFDVSAHARDRTETATVTVGAAAAVLTGAKLVMVEVHGTTVDRVTTSGSCSVAVAADVVDVRLALPWATEVYREYLLYTTLVDGAPYEAPRAHLCQTPTHGRSLHGAVGADRLFTTCDDESPLSPGVHAVAMRVETPDGRSLTTREQKFTLRCDGVAAGPVRVEVEEEEPEEGPVIEARSKPVSEPMAAPVGPPAVRAGCGLAGAVSPWWVLVSFGMRRRGDIVRG